MNKIFTLFLTVFLLSNCTTVQVNSHLLQPGDQVKKYSKVLFLFSDSEEMFYDWDEENYQYALWGRFNSLDQERFRRSLANSIASSLSGTQILLSDKYFPIHRPVSYQDFMKKLEEIDFDAILIVNLRELYQTEVFLDGDVAYKPNISLHSFLIDREDFSNIYLAQINAHGAVVHTNLDMMNRYSRRLAADLYAKGLINNPRQFKSYP